MADNRDNSDNSLERALETLEADADGVVRELAAALKEAKNVKSAAATGQLRELRQAMDNSVRLAESAKIAVDFTENADLGDEASGGDTEASSAEGDDGWPQ